MRTINILLLLFLVSCNNEKEDFSEVNSSSKIEQSDCDKNEKTFSINDIDISLMIPENWEYDIISNEMFYLKKSLCGDTLFCDNIVLSVFNDDSDHEAFIEYYLQGLKDKIDTLHIVGKSDIFFDGVGNGNIVDFGMKSNGINLGSTVALITFGEKKVIINFSALNQPKGVYAEHRKVFIAFLETISFVKKQRNYPF